MPVDPSYLDRAALAPDEKVRLLSERKEWTQHQLAKVSGVSRNQIQNIEHSRNNSPDPETGQPGRGNPPLETTYLLASALDVHPIVLVDSGIPLPGDWY